MSALEADLLVGLVDGRNGRLCATGSVVDTSALPHRTLAVFMVYGETAGEAWRLADEHAEWLKLCFENGASGAEDG